MAKITCGYCKTIFDSKQIAKISKNKNKESWYFVGDMCTKIAGGLIAGSSVSLYNSITDPTKGCMAFVIFIIMFVIALALFYIGYKTMSKNNLKGSI